MVMISNDKMVVFCFVFCTKYEVRTVSSVFTTANSDRRTGNGALMGS